MKGDLFARLKGGWPVPVLTLVCFGVYANALGNGFVLDDSWSVVGNPGIKDFRSLIHMFISPGASQKILLDYFRPLQYVFYFIQFKLGGFSPAFFHSGNVFFHAGVTVLVYLLVLEIRGGAMPAFLAALLFAVNPVHTEAVNWVSALCEIAFSFFYLGSLILYIKAFKGGSPRKGFLALSLFSFFLSLLSKETAITFFLALFSLDTAFARPGPLKKPAIYLKRYAVYLAPAICYLAYRTAALGRVVPATTLKNNTAGLVSIPSVFFAYLKTLFVPYRLVFWREFSTLHSAVEARVAVACLVTALFIIAIPHAYRKDRMIFAGLLFILIPTSACVVSGRYWHS